jgi:hypothetical protein
MKMTTWADGCGTIFKLTPSSSGWIYTSLHDFTGGSDGGWPHSNVILDASGESLRHRLLRRKRQLPVSGR